MNNIEQIKAPSGQIEMILHRGGEYDVDTGKIIGGKVIAEREIENLIVAKASALMAARLAPGSATGTTLEGNYLDNGLQYLAVGVGTLTDPTKPYNATTNPVASSWNMQNPPAATDTAFELVGELFRKKFTSWSFVNTSNDDLPPGTTKSSSGTNTTNVLRLVTTFLETEANGPLTEMGIFGGNATTTKDSGYMFNYKTYPVWNKPNDARLTITWKLTF